MSKIVLTEGKGLWWWSIEQEGYETTVGHSKSKEKSEKRAREVVQDRYDIQERRANATVIELPDFISNGEVK